MALIAGASGIAGVLATQSLPKVGVDGGEPARARRRLGEMPAALVPIGFLMFFTTITEGAMADWSAIYLSERQSISVTEAGIAVTIFAGFMAASRFSGDWLKRHLGAVLLARVSVAFSVAGLLCLIIPLPLAFAFVGFAFIGLGVAAGYPLGVSAIAALDDEHEAANVAIMSTFSLTGFLLGPPVIGGLAEAFGLRMGFAVLFPGLLLCLWLATWLAPRESPGESPESAV